MSINFSTNYTIGPNAHSVYKNCLVFKVNFSVPSFIPIKESFIYLGITIYKNIHKIARDNFNNILVKVKTDIQRWKTLKVSLQGRISTVKMNLLPRFNFFFSMLPLSPPPGYFKEINSP